MCQETTKMWKKKPGNFILFFWLVLLQEDTRWILSPTCNFKGKFVTFFFTCVFHTFQRLSWAPHLVHISLLWVVQQTGMKQNRNMLSTRTWLVPPPQLGHTPAAGLLPVTFLFSSHTQHRNIANNDDNDGGGLRVCCWSLESSSFPSCCKKQTRRNFGAKSQGAVLLWKREKETNQLASAAPGRW